MEEELYRSHPAMFRNNPLGFILALLLVPVGVGLIILLVWWIQTLATTIIITNLRTTLRTGILSKNTNEVLHEHVRSLQVSQGILQRLFNVGQIAISSSGQAGIEITVRGIPDPEGVKALIDRHRFSKEKSA